MPVTPFAATRKPYAPPTATRVYVDPIRELLLNTACLVGTNDPGACTSDPGCVPAGTGQ